MTRSPIVAGSFYEASAAACRENAEALLAAAQLPESTPQRCYGGLVPHAGWVCSGAIAAITLKALARQWSGGPVVLLGAIHSPSGPEAMIYDRGSWETPLGEVAVDADLAAKIVAACPDVVVDCHAHGREHSLEVQIPLLQVLWPEVTIVPILVPPSARAVDVGSQVGKVLAGCESPPPVVGSTDLTHYGPRYGIAPAGVGPQGIAWSVENDKALLELVQHMAADRIVDHADRHHSACGAGAIAATMAACAELGAQTGVVLCHTNSYETLKAFNPNDTSTAVGYTSVVFA